MKEHVIEIKSTNIPSILKFETNQFLVKHKTYEFGNIDEAGSSPLAQKLFMFPFVKTVFIAQNFIGIEKYDIVEWSDIEEEIATTIKDFLNTGGEVVQSSEEEPTNIPVSVYAESTPNPTTMKFITNRKLVLRSIEFKNIDEATHSKLAQALFHFPFVKQVFFDENYVSISKYDIAEWEEITMELREFITKYLQEGKEVYDAPENDSTPNAAQASNNASSPAAPLDDTSKEIVAILDEYVKPAVATDGGNIQFESYDPETKRVKVILQGACSGCPSSTLTLKNGIENMLKEMMNDKVESVDAING